MNNLFNFAKSFLVAPSDAADACDRPSALGDGLKIYAALAVAELASSRFDPLSFLDPAAPARYARTVGFWLGLALWQPILTATSIALTILLLEWLREGRLPLKTAAATIWSALPVALTVYYASPNAGSSGWFIALLAVWAAPAVLLAKRIAPERRRRVAAFLLGMSAIQIVGLVFEFAVVVPTRSLNAFYAYSALMLIWVAACFGIGMRRMKITDSMARAVLAFIFALLVGSVAPWIAYRLGLMPKEILKAVLYV